MTEFKFTTDSDSQNSQSQESSQDSQDGNDIEIRYEPREPLTEEEQQFLTLTKTMFDTGDYQALRREYVEEFKRLGLDAQIKSLAKKAVQRRIVESKNNDIAAAPGDGSTQEQSIMSIKAKDVVEDIFESAFDLIPGDLLTKLFNRVHPIIERHVEFSD